LNEEKIVKTIFETTFFLFLAVLGENSVFVLKDLENGLSRVEIVLLI
jgi:hypothetical protein